MTEASRTGRAVTRTGRAAAGGVGARARETAEQAGSAAGRARAAARAGSDEAGRSGESIAGEAGQAGRSFADEASQPGESIAGEAGRTGESFVGSLPVNRLVQSAQGLLQAAGTRMLSSAGDKIEGLTGRLTDYVEHGGKGLMGAITGSDKPGGVLSGAVKGGLKGLLQRFTGGGRGKGDHAKLTNIVETVDIGAPRRLVYDQWTRFQDFPTFMKKVENVKQEADEELNWKAQVFWSHRNWKAHIVEQIPDQRVIWRSEGAKGHVDGVVTFHEITPDLTRVLVVLEYHPQGLFERTGNLWRAQGRRVRLELKHFRRHVMTHLLLHPDDVEGWRGEIRDSEVVKDHETAVEEERAQDEREAAQGEPHWADREQPEDEGEPEEEAPEEEAPEEEETEEEPEEAPVRGRGTTGAVRRQPAEREHPVRRRRIRTG